MSKQRPIRETTVPRQYRYIIDRGLYEISRAQSNLAFMLDKHLDDADSTEFINSELFKRLLEQCIDARIEAWILFQGVFRSLNIKDTNSAQISWSKEDNQYSITEWKR